MFQYYFWGFGLKVDKAYILMGSKVDKSNILLRFFESDQELIGIVEFAIAC